MSMRRIKVIIHGIETVSLGARYRLTLRDGTNLIRGYTQPGSPLNSRLQAGDIRVGESGTATVRDMRGRQYVSHWESEC